MCYALTDHDHANFFESSFSGMVFMRIKKINEWFIGKKSSIVENH